MSTKTARPRAEANRENARHSTGPRTETGKSRSKLNALNHGLASSAVVLPYEDASEYEALKAAFEEQHQPGSDLETQLLGRMVDCWWRLQRAYRVEAQFLALRERTVSRESEDLSGDMALATLFDDPKEMARMRLFMRYLGAAERASNRATADFEKAKKERIKSESEAIEQSGSTLLAEMDRYLNAPIPVLDLASFGNPPYVGSETESGAQIPASAHQNPTAESLQISSPVPG